MSSFEPAKNNWIKRLQLFKNLKYWRVTWNN